MHLENWFIILDLCESFEMNCQQTGNQEPSLSVRMTSSFLSLFVKSWCEHEPYFT